jgi:hypothetical protein
MSNLLSLILLLLAILAGFAGYYFGRLQKLNGQVFLAPRTALPLHQQDLANLDLTPDNIRKHIGLAIVETLVGHSFVPGRKFWSTEVLVKGRDFKGTDLIEEYKVHEAEIVSNELALVRISYNLCAVWISSEPIKGFEVLVALMPGFRFKELDRLDLEERARISNVARWGYEYRDGPHFQVLNYAACIERPSTGEDRYPGVAVRIEGKMQMYRNVLEGSPFVVRERFFRDRLIRFNPSEL